MLDLHVLPRDVQISILGKCDIDTRIKGGIIGRLNVPFALQAKLSECLHLPKCLDFDSCQKFYIWKLGRDDDHSLNYWTYTIIKEIDDYNRVTTSVYNRFAHYIICDHNVTHFT